MIRDLKPYPAYKDSGVPWLGQVPKHWKVSRLKTRLLRNDAGVWSEEFDDNGTVVLRSTEQTVDGGWRIVTPARLRLTERQRNNSLLSEGDLVVTKSSGSPAHIGKTSIVSHEIANLMCCFSNFMQRLRTNRTLVPEFVWRLLNSSIGREQLVFQSTTTTGLGNLNGEILGNCWLPISSLAEQSAIVRFLNEVDRRIQGYIQAKQQLIKLLEEQKQVIIHRAVTRGLDSAVPLKPSGIEWLGEVPEHWEILRTRYLFRENDRRSQTGAETHLSMSQKLGLVPSSMVEQRTLVSETYVGGKLCDEGDLVLNRLKAHLGVFALAKQSGLVSPDYTVLRRTRPMVMQYFEHILRSPGFRHELRIRAKGIVEGFWRLYTDDFYDIRVPVPPVTEQRRIVDALDAETKSVIGAMKRTEREIDLFREYRTSLIAEVVTGKLDVREAASELSEEVDEFARTENLQGAVLQDLPSDFEDDAEEVPA
jgi:type I restriction enzyme, S subunit